MTALEQRLIEGGARHVWCVTWQARGDDERTTVVFDGPASAREALQELLAEGWEAWSFRTVIHVAYAP